MAQDEFLLTIVENHSVAPASRAQHAGPQRGSGPTAGGKGRVRYLVDKGSIVYDGAVSGFLDSVVQTRSSRFDIA